ncbi:MAG: hypothetical protein ACLU4P_05840 [Ruminococcus sp.]
MSLPTTWMMQRGSYEALKEYRGSVLLICHEPEFYQDVVSQVDCSKWIIKIP